MNEHIGFEDEYEEISSEQVDEVVAALEGLAQRTDSETIRAMLEDAAADIYNLFYADDDAEDDVADAA